MGPTKWQNKGQQDSRMPLPFWTCICCPKLCQCMFNDKFDVYPRSLKIIVEVQWIRFLKLKKELAESRWHCRPTILESKLQWQEQACLAERRCFNFNANCGWRKSPTLHSGVTTGMLKTSAVFLHIHHELLQLYLKSVAIFWQTVCSFEFFPLKIFTLTKLCRANLPKSMARVRPPPPLAMPGFERSSRCSTSLISSSYKAPELRGRL